MGEVINKEYLTRADLLAMRREIDTVLSMIQLAGERIDGIAGQVSAHGKLISSLVAESAVSLEEHSVRISNLENELAPTNMRQV